MEAICAPVDAQFDFDTLLLDALAVEAASIDGDDAEGYDISCVPWTPFSSPSPLSPVPDAISDFKAAVPDLTLPPLRAPKHLQASMHATREEPPSQLQGSIEKQRKKGAWNAKRARQRAQRRDATPYDFHGIHPSTHRRHVASARMVQTSLQAEQLPHTKNAYTGGREKTSSRRVFELEDLIGPASRHRFKLVRWDGRVSKPIIDGSGRIIGVLVGFPNDPTWEHVHAAAAEAIKEAREHMVFPSKLRKHRRGDFPAVAIGVSFGGGQKRPGNLVNTPANTPILEDLLKSSCIKRVAGFASAAFATWAPKLYAYYADHMGPLFGAYPHLHRNFRNSIFACATINFGPTTCTFEHRDTGNLPFGWCAITALGNFDYTKGGHLVLWDMGLVVEFPPGSTILIPSASIRHSNIAIREDEIRYSFTQYSAGGLFRWVDHGLQPATKFYANLDHGELWNERERSKERWAMGINMFSNWDEFRYEALST